MNTISSKGTVSSSRWTQQIPSELNKIKVNSIRLKWTNQVQIKNLGQKIFAHN